MNIYFRKKKFKNQVTSLESIVASQIYQKTCIKHLKRVNDVSLAYSDNSKSDASSNSKICIERRKPGRFDQNIVIRLKLSKIYSYFSLLCVKHVWNAR